MSITQKLSKRGAILAASLVLGAAFTASSLTAQTVSTAPVGAVTTTIPVGLTPVGITLLNPDLLVSNSTSSTTTSITLSGATNVGALLTSGLPYYVEAISGPLVGDRFDVDTAATITAANGSVVINTSSANNTFTLAASSAVGSQFALRKHVTLAQIQASCSSALVGNNVAANADQIWFYSSATDTFNIYYLRADLVNWRASGSTANVPNTAVPAGVGIFFRKVTSPTTLVSTGGVRINNFSLPLQTGLSLNAPAYPVSFSPSDFGGTAANGWTGNNTAANADQLQTYDSATDSFVSYYLRLDGTTWRQSGTTTAVTTNKLFAYDSAYLVSRKTANQDYTLISPISNL
jgi:hypothetical protein